MEKIKLAVYNEYALGYIMPERPDTFYTLKDSVLRGAPWRVMREPISSGRTLPSDWRAARISRISGSRSKGTTIRCTSSIPP